MPSFCSVINCSMRAERDQVRFFRFPAILKNRGNFLQDLSTRRREAWVRALKRGPLTESQLKNGRICSRHFLTGAPAPSEDRLNPDWIPNQNLGYLTNEPHQAASSRHERSMKRAKYKAQSSAEIPPDITHESSVEGQMSVDEDLPQEISVAEVHGHSTSVSVQTDLTEEQLCGLFSDLNYSNTKIYSLKSKLERLDLNEDSFRNDDRKTNYFTGFPKAGMLFVVLDIISPHLSTHFNTVLSPFQQLLLTLMKLRLNLPFKYLSYRFSVSPTTVSDTFYKCIDELYNKFKDLVYWPEREALQKNVPACFEKAFGNRVAVVIDCFEVFTETPSNLLNAARCWSNYKHHETVKFLIGITPHGTISYVSAVWGGRTSDKFVTENCGFLDFIIPGDIILADRGFIIKESIEMLGAHLKIPAFTKGKNQLHPIDIETTRNIATVRIHVERIIGLLKKKYHIFHDTIPLSMVSNKRNNVCVLDKIVIVCSSFINLCPSQIPLE